MRSTWFWGLAGIVALVGGASSAHAGVDPDFYRYEVLIDSDNNTATGCTVSLHDANFNGSVSGVEYIVRADVDRFPISGTVAGVTVSTCISGTAFDVPLIITNSTWPVGLENGVPAPSASGFADVVEFYAPRADIGDPGTMRLYFHASRALLNDVLLTTNGEPTGDPIVFALGRSAPTLSPLGLALAAAMLAAVGWWTMSRRSRLASALIGSTFFISLAVAAWAVTIALDGNVADWAGIPRAGTDALNDSSAGDPAEDIVAAFVTADATNLYFRMDQVNLAPVVCGNGIVESGEHCESVSDCLGFCDPTAGSLCDRAPEVIGGQLPTPCSCTACQCVGNCTPP